MLHQFSLYVICVFLAIGGSLLITPVIKKYAINRNLYDIPNGRSSHKKPIPRVGGIAIIASFLVTSLFGSGIALFAFSDIPCDLVNTVVIISGGLLIAAVGLYDDIKGMRAVVKLVFQIAVAVYAVSFGLKMDLAGFFDGTHLEPYAGVASFVLSVFWIVSIINAVNLMDGLDGLAGGISAIAMSALFILLYMAGSLTSPIIALALIGAIIGFLYHNYHPASIFMGDTGSLFLGFVLATFPLPLSFDLASGSGLWLIPLCVLYLPLFDMTSCFVRRICEGRSPFSADKKHLHHRIYSKHCNGDKKGYRKTVHRLYGIAVVFTLLSLVPFMRLEFSSVLIVLGVAAMTLNLLVRYHYLDPIFEAMRARRRTRYIKAYRRRIRAAATSSLRSDQRVVSGGKQEEPISASY